MSSVITKIKGWIGEIRVKLIIGKTKEGRKYVINNLLLNVGENKTSQIDHILINPNGIFVIETKNYSGRIYGQENQLEWTQVFNYGRVKNKLYNPIKQNKTHIFHISNALTEDIPIISAVVFIHSNIRFINAEGVYGLYGLKHLIKRPHTKLSAIQMKKAYAEIMHARAIYVSNNEHVKNVHLMKSDIDNNICPRCGKNLVLRKGKYGDFYGCLGYPKCRFIKKH